MFYKTSEKGKKGETDQIIDFSLSLLVPSWLAPLLSALAGPLILIQIRLVMEFSILNRIANYIIQKINSVKLLFLGTNCAP